MKWGFVVCALAVLCLCDYYHVYGENNEEEKMSIQITSSAFKHEGMIPARFTCDGEDISPPLKWENLPQSTQSIAIIADDPDAPMGTFVHWVLYNLPANTRQLPEAVPAKEVLDDGAVQGKTDFGRFGYGGPCPPSGTHRYFFKIYALDKRLEIVGIADKSRLLNAMQGHIVGQGELMGKYKRK